MASAEFTGAYSPYDRDGRRRHRGEAERSGRPRDDHRRSEDSAARDRDSRVNRTDEEQEGSIDRQDTRGSPLRKKSKGNKTYDLNANPSTELLAMDDN